jgi:hypothetical protein
MDKPERPAAHVQNAEPVEACPGLPKAFDFLTPIAGNVQIPIGRQSLPSAPKIEFEALGRQPANSRDAIQRPASRPKVLLEAGRVKWLAWQRSDSLGRRSKRFKSHYALKDGNSQRGVEILAYVNSSLNRVEAKV